MARFQRSRIRLSQQAWQISILAVLTNIIILVISAPAIAHHPTGGKLPVGFVAGFMSGLGHPIIGFDHFAFIVAVGLLSATKRQGILLPIAFVVAAIAGTGFHLMQLALPSVELFVAGSILLFGLLLVLQNSLNLGVIMGLATIAGLFHGYAYGEAIFGAEMTEFAAYLAGFTVIQFVIAMSAFWISKKVLQRPEQQYTFLRAAGFVICGVGLAFLSSQIVDAIFAGAKFEVLLKFDKLSFDFKQSLNSKLWVLSMLSKL